MPTTAVPAPTPGTWTEFSRTVPRDGTLTITANSGAAVYITVGFGVADNPDRTNSRLDLKIGSWTVFPVDIPITKGEDIVARSTGATSVTWTFN